MRAIPLILKQYSEWIIEPLNYCKLLPISKLRCTLVSKFNCKWMISRTENNLKYFKLSLKFATARKLIAQLAWSYWSKIGTFLESVVLCYIPSEDFGSYNY